MTVVLKLGMLGLPLPLAGLSPLLVDDDCKEDFVKSLTFNVDQVAAKTFMCKLLTGEASSWPSQHLDLTMLPQRLPLARLCETWS